MGSASIHYLKISDNTIKNFPTTRTPNKKQEQNDNWVAYRKLFLYSHRASLDILRRGLFMGGMLHFGCTLLLSREVLHAFIV
jgi:hypothetical protein